jgi:hypothetical protein
MEKIDIDSLEIRWIPAAGAFFVDFGNARFALSPTAAILLADGLREAVRLHTPSLGSVPKL